MRLVIAGFLTLIILIMANISRQEETGNRVKETRPHTCYFNFNLKETWPFNEHFRGISSKIHPPYILPDINDNTDTQTFPNV